MVIATWDMGVYKHPSPIVTNTLPWDNLHATHPYTIYDWKLEHLDFACAYFEHWVFYYFVSCR
jgi:hypothetical protein